MEEQMHLINTIRKTFPSKIAEELCIVQPMPNVDLKALAESDLWHSYCLRHLDIPVI